LQQANNVLLELHTIPREVVERIWFEVKNMMGAQLEWDWMTEKQEGEYIERAAVLKMIEKYLT